MTCRLFYSKIHYIDFYLSLSFDNNESEHLIEYLCEIKDCFPISYDFSKACRVCVSVRCTSALHSGGMLGPALRADSQAL